MITINTAEFTKDIQRVTSKLGRLGGLIDDLVPDAVNPIIVRLMQIYPPNNHTVTRAQAYPEAILTTPRGKIIRGYFSFRQYRYVMMLANMGRLPYRRTFAMRRAWRIVGRGKNSVVVNDTDAAIYSMDDTRQARLNRLVGWTTAGWRMQHPGDEVRKAAINGIKSAIRRAGFRR